MDKIKPKDSLKAFKLDAEDPHPKKPVVKLNQKKKHTLIRKLWHNFWYFFVDIWLAIKELARSSM